MKKENDIREVGIVASGSKPTNLRFYSQEQITDDYVMVEVEDEHVIYEIMQVDAYNSRMEDTEFVRHILPGEDYSQYNVYRSNAIPLGTIKNGGIIPSNRWFVAPPGKVVKAVDNEEVALIYGVEPGKNKQRIGRLLRHEQIPVWLNFPKLLTTHMALVGRSGHGKSNMVKVLLKNLPIKYIVFTKVNEYLGVENAVTDDLECAVLSWNIETFKKIFDLNHSETKYLKECVLYYAFQGKIHTEVICDYVRKYYSMCKSYQQVNMFEFATEQAEPLPKYVESLCKKLEDLRIEIDFDSNGENVENSRIINMQKISDKEEEITIFSFLTTLLAERRKAFKGSQEELELKDRIVIFIEEAHNYIPSSKAAISRDIIRLVAREGRKLGIHLVILSQRPRHLDPTALSQCGTIVSFNLVNPEDIDYLMSNANFHGEYYKNMIRDLGIGECMIISDFMPKGINCKIDLDCPSFEHS